MGLLKDLGGAVAKNTYRNSGFWIGGTLALALAAAAEKTMDYTIGDTFDSAAQFVCDNSSGICSEKERNLFSWFPGRD